MLACGGPCHDAVRALARLRIINSAFGLIHLFNKIVRIFWMVKTVLPLLTHVLLSRCRRNRKRPGMMDKKTDWVKAGKGNIGNKKIFSCFSQSRYSHNTHHGEEKKKNSGCFENEFIVNISYIDKCTDDQTTDGNPIHERCSESRIKKDGWDPKIGSKENDNSQPFMKSNSWVFLGE